LLACDGDWLSIHAVKMFITLDGPDNVLRTNTQWINP